MQKISRFLPGLVAAALFLPTLLVPRSALNQALNAADIMMILVLAAHFGSLLLMTCFSQDSGIYFAASERKGFRLVILAFYATAVTFLLLMLYAGEVPRAVLLSGAAGLAFGLYDVLKIAATVQGRRQLQRLVWLHVGLPMAIACSVTFISVLPNNVPYAPNTITIFFMIRAVLGSR